MNSQPNFRLAGRYKLEVIRSNGERRLVSPWFDNLVLDAGLNRIGGNAPFGFAMVGTGTTAPAIGQTALVAQVGSTSTQQGSVVTGVDAPNGYSYMRITYRFGVGVATGTLSEVGVGWSSTDCFSRALIVDGGGSPTTVTVLADEELDLTYELRAYWPLSDLTGVIALDSINYSTRVRTALNGTWNDRWASFIAGGVSITSADVSLYPAQASLSAFGDQSTAPSGTAGVISGALANNGAYVSNQFYRNYRLTVGLSAYTSPIGAALLTTPLGYYKVMFDAPIPKSGSNTLQLDFRLTFGRYTEFVGINPAIGNINVTGFRLEGTSASVTVTARLEFRSNGSIWQISTLIGGTTHTVKIGNWYTPNGTNVGDNREIQFDLTGGSGGTVNSNANGSYLEMNAVDAYIELTHTSTGFFNWTRTLTYSIRPVGGSVEATGNVTLQVTRED
jgi:hypothetical protein